MSDTIQNLFLGVAFVVVLITLILRRRGNTAKTKMTKKPAIGRIR